MQAVTKLKSEPTTAMSETQSDYLMVPERALQLEALLESTPLMVVSKKGMVRMSGSQSDYLMVPERALPLENLLEPT